MTGSRRALLAAFLATCFAPAALAGDAARPSLVVVPMFGDGVTLSVPAGWVKAHQQKNERQAILEFVPAGQTVQAWNEMITVQAFKGLPAEATPRRLLESIAGRMRGVGPEHAVATGLGDLKVGERPAHAAIIGCATVPAGAAGAGDGQGELAYYVAIRGANDMVVVQRAVRGRAFDRQRPPITPQVATAMHGAMAPLSVCALSEPPGKCGPGATR